MRVLHEMGLNAFDELFRHTRILQERTNKMMYGCVFKLLCMLIAPD